LERFSCGGCSRGFFDGAEEDTDPPDAYWALPEFPNDEDFEMAREICFEDHDVLDLFDDDDDDAESSEEIGEDDGRPRSHPALDFMQSAVGQQVMGFAHMGPEEWFVAFRPEHMWREQGHVPPPRGQ